MDYVIKIIGIIVSLLGIILLIDPGVFGRVLEFIKVGKRIYYAALIRLVFGAIFLLGARECSIPWVIVVFGVFFILKGLAFVVLGPAKITPKLELWQNKSNLVIRGLALLPIVLGYVIIYSA